MRWVSSQLRRSGPSVEGIGDGSRIVRCRDPALGWTGKDTVVGDTAGEPALEGASVRWQSFSRAGIEDAGKRAGREKAWIDANISDAYGNCADGPGIESGRTLGYCFGRSGDVER